MSFADWMKRSKIFTATQRRLNCYSPITDICRAAYKAGERDGRKQAEAIIAQKDAEIIEQCRINGMGAERELALLGKVAQQSAALKLAKEALADAMEWCICQDSNFYKPCEEALAAINALKGE